LKEVSSAVPDEKQKGVALRKDPDNPVNPVKRGLDGINPPKGGRRDQYDNPCRRASRALQYFGGEQPKAGYLEKSVDKTEISR